VFNSPLTVNVKAIKKTNKVLNFELRGVGEKESEGNERKTKEEGESKETMVACDEGGRPN